ncbi:MAG: DUF2207 domain-containing protein [Dethiobacteria bacterium]
MLIEAEIHPDGSMTVVEKRTFSFEGRYRGAWEYIYLKHNASIKDVLVSEGGEAYRQEAPGTRDIPGIFYVEEHPGHVYIDWSFEAANEQRTFTISYTVENAVLVHQDVAELYYQFIGGEWDERYRSCPGCINPARRRHRRRAAGLGTWPATGIRFKRGDEPGCLGS